MCAYVCTIISLQFRNTVIRMRSNGVGPVSRSKVCLQEESVCVWLSRHVQGSGTTQALSHTYMVILRAHKSASVTSCRESTASVSTPPLLRITYLPEALEVFSGSPRCLPLPPETTACPRCSAGNYPSSLRRPTFLAEYVLNSRGEYGFVWWHCPRKHVVCF